MNKKVILIILDGWGIGIDPKVSAIHRANTPFVDSLYSKYANSRLKASGLAVGLPEGQMGNSEVGHINIGAGRVVDQILVRLNNAVADGTLQSNEKLLDAFAYAKQNDKAVHFIGLVSDGGIHAHINHVKALCSSAAKQGLSNLFIHAFTDGRDTDTKSGKAHLSDLQNHLDQTTGRIASVTGRCYAMDRDQRWEKVKVAYDAMVNGVGTKTTDIAATIEDSYAENITDEFVRPIIHTNANGQPIATIQPDDVVVFFNFRTDRGRQLTEALTQQDFIEIGMKKLSLRYYTMTNYNDTFSHVEVMYDKDNLRNTLGEVLSKANKKQIRIAESEKYPHVTFFFSGGREKEFEGEKRILRPSPKVATYDLQPEMSATDITDATNVELEKNQADFICLNFANPDMVGHTGVFEAAIKACETVDRCTKSVVETAQANGYTAIIVADHGNSDIMKNPDGSPNTTHTTNLVPCIFVDADIKNPVKDGRLCDLAPTILKLIGVEIPKEMTGEELI